MKKVTVLGLLAILAISVHATEPMEGIADEVAAYLAPDTANDAIDNFLADLQGGACPSGGCDGCWWRSTRSTLRPALQLVPETKERGVLSQTRRHSHVGEKGVDGARRRRRPRPRRRLRPSRRPRPRRSSRARPR